MAAFWANLLNKLERSRGEMSETAAARMMGLSVWRFSRKFRSVAGITFRQARVRAKVNSAIQLLKTGREIPEIAAILGYSERSKLEKAFKRLTGQTPASYRKKSSRQVRA